MHKGIMDTALTCGTAVSLTPLCNPSNVFANSKLQSIFEKTLTCVSGAHGKLFDEEKNQKTKISCQGHFYNMKSDIKGGANLPQTILSLIVETTYLGHVLEGSGPVGYREKYLP
jgi:hypothetical protein